MRAFLASAYRGYDFARSNPEQAAEIILKMYPTLDAQVALEQIRGTNDLITDKGLADKPLGHLREDRMASSLAFVDKAFDMKGKVKLQDIFTNEFLGK